MLLTVALVGVATLNLALPAPLLPLRSLFHALFPKTAISEFF